MPSETTGEDSAKTLSIVVKLLNDTPQDYNIMVSKMFLGRNVHPVIETQAYGQVQS